MLITSDNYREEDDDTNDINDDINITEQEDYLFVGDGESEIDNLEENIKPSAGGDDWLSIPIYWSGTRVIMKTRDKEVIEPDYALILFFDDETRYALTATYFQEKYKQLWRYRDGGHEGA